MKGILNFVLIWLLFHLLHINGQLVDSLAISEDPSDIQLAGITSPTSDETTSSFFEAELFEITRKNNTSITFMSEVSEDSINISHAMSGERVPRRDVMDISVVDPATVVRTENLPPIFVLNLDRSKDR
jgi:hypothetical protein